MAWTQSAVGDPPVAPTGGAELGMTQPPAKRPIDALYTSTTYNSFQPGSNYPPAYTGPVPPFGKKVKHQAYYIPYTGPYTENPQGSWGDTVTYPNGQGELYQHNKKWSQAIVDRLTNAEVNWMVGKYGDKLTREVQNVRIAGKKPDARTILVEFFATRFTLESTVIEAFLRVALQGAQPMDQDNIEAELTASIGGNTPTEPLTSYIQNFNQRARDWLQQRDALAWPAAVEVLLSIPSVNRSEGIEIEGQQWGGPLKASIAFRRHDWNTPADYEPLDLPELTQVSPMLKWYGWTQWKTNMSDSNRVASYALARMLPDDNFNAFVGEYGVDSTKTKQEQTVALAEMWAAQATETNQSLMVAIARDPTATDRTLETIAQAAIQAEAASGAGRLWVPRKQRRRTRPALRGLDAAREAAGRRLQRKVRAAGKRVSGAGKNFFQTIADGFKRLVTHPKKWFANVTEQLGRFLETIGREVRRWGRVPIIGDLFLASTAFDFIFGTVLIQFGHAMQEGSIGAINWTEMADGVARVFDAAGKVTAMVAPFLPVPFNLVAAAIAALSIAAGKGIRMLVHRKDVEKAVEQYNEAQEAEFQAQLALAAEQAAAETARQQALIDQAAANANETWMSWLEENDLLGKALHNASENDPKSVRNSGSGAGRKLAIAAGIVLPIGLAALVWASTRK